MTTPPWTTAPPDNCAPWNFPQDNSSLDFYPSENCHLIIPPWTTTTWTISPHEISPRTITPRFLSQDNYPSIIPPWNSPLYIFLRNCLDFYLEFFFFKFLEPPAPRTSLSDCFCAFLPFCIVFGKEKKKNRKTVSEKLHPCLHALEYLHRLLSFSNILTKFCLKWIEFYGDEIWWDS